MAGSNTKKKTTASGKTAGKKTAGTKTTAAKRTGTKKQEADSSFLQSEAVILGTFAVCVFLFLSNFHICGMLGDMFSSMRLGVFGSIGYVAPVLLFLGTIFYALSLIHISGNGWYKIRSGNITGYVSSEFILTGDAARQAAMEHAELMAIVSTDRLNARTEPSTDAKIWTRCV